MGHVGTLDVRPGQEVGEPRGGGDLGDGAVDQVVDHVPEVPSHALQPPAVVPDQGSIVPLANISYPPPPCRHLLTERPIIFVLH